MHKHVDLGQKTAVTWWRKKAPNLSHLLKDTIAKLSLSKSWIKYLIPFEEQWIILEGNRNKTNQSVQLFMRNLLTLIQASIQSTRILPSFSLLPGPLFWTAVCFTWICYSLVAILDSFPSSIHRCTINVCQWNFQMLEYPHLLIRTDFKNLLCQSMHLVFISRTRPILTVWVLNYGWRNHPQFWTWNVSHATTVHHNQFCSL